MGRRLQRGRARTASVAVWLLALAGLVGVVALPARSADEASAQPTESEAEANAEPAAEVSEASGSTATTAPAATASKPPVEVGPELTPYNVLLRLNVPIDSELTARFRERLAAEVATGIRSSLGQMWNATVELSDDPRAASPASLGRTSAEALTAEFADSGLDKVFLAGARRSGSCWTIVAREWDAASQTAGSVGEASTCDNRLVAALTSDLVMRTFRPVARIEEVSGDVVVTNIRAGEYPAADPAYAPFTEGDLLVPYVRYYDRDRTLLQIRDMPHTYLQVGQVTRARMECRTMSAYRTPLSGSRRRMEIIAIAARPAFPATRLIIATRGSRADTLPGCRVEVLNRVPTADDPVEDRLELLTDRRGAIVITADPSHPLQHVLVHSGKAMLARIPLIPGLEETMTLGIPDDSARLAVEGSLSVLEGELIDTVARRSMLMARARRASKSRNWDEVGRFVEELQTIPDYEEFEKQVSAVQQVAVQSAAKLGDKVAEARIKKMCSQLRESASGFLDKEKIREFRLEMDELKAATR